MTQPFDPRLLNVTAANPLAVDPAELVALHQQSLAQQQAEQAQHVAPSASEQQSAAIRQQIAELDGNTPEQQELEATYGKTGTAAIQFGRGALDYLLMPGALLGAGIEGIGEAADSKGLRDFGRGLGRASQGDELMSTLNPDTLRAVFGGDKEKGLSEYEAMHKAIEEDEKAWPMLSTTSRVLGGVAGGLGVGGLASGTASLATTAGAAAYEGAGFGAQSAYAQNASLRDVMSSALLGAAIGGAMPVGMHYGGELASKAARGAAKTLSGSARELADESALKAIGARGTDLRRLVGNKVGEAADEKLATVGQDLLNYTMESGPDAGKKLLRAGLKAEDMAENVVRAKNDVGRQLGALRKGIAEETGPDLGKFLKSVDDDFLTELKNSTSPTIRARADKVESELASLREMATSGEKVPLGKLERIRKDLRDAFQPPKPAGGGLPAAVPEHAEYLQRAERMLSDAIESHSDDILSKSGKGGQLAELKRQYSSLASAEAIVNKAAKQDLGNRAVSLTDYMTGLGAGGAAGGPAGVAAGLATTFGHKLLRERGRSMVAVLADKLARSGIGHAEEAAVSPLQRLFGQVEDHARDVVSVEAAGGREAQGVIADLYAARKAAQEAAEKAGANPEARHVAVQQASEQLREKLAQKTGAFNPAEWSTKAPKPLQKFFYRSQILDQAATDTAAAVERVAARNPGVGFELDPKRLGKLLKDADGPAAIGGLQSKLRQLATEAPNTVEGYALRDSLAKAAHGLENADLPGTMVQGHQVAKSLLAAAEGAQDDITKGWAQRQARAVMDELGSERFGSAGSAYREAIADASDQFKAMAERDTIREALRTADVRGKLGQVVREHADLMARAADAQAKLAGVTKPKELVKGLRDLEELVSKAEDAATLDGGPIGRVFDFFKNRTEDRVAAVAGGAQDPGAIVTKFVKPKLEQIAHLAKGSAEGVASDRAKNSGIQSMLGEHQAERAAANAATHLLSRAEQQSQYAERLKTLQDVAMGGHEDTVTDGVAAVDNITPGLGAYASNDMQQKVQTLLQDMPKPPGGVRGRPENALSSEDLRLSNAMWEATMEPMSVFDDFSSGTVDYDKVQYAWKQYPGLHQAAQMGLMDILHEQMSDEDREAMPDSMVTQLDMLFGMNGTLAPTIEQGFSSRIDQAAQSEGQQKQQPPPRGASLDMPSARASFTQRLSGQQR